MALSKDFKKDITKIRLQREEAYERDRILLSELKTLKSEIKTLKSVKVEINDNGQLIMKKLLGELKNTSNKINQVHIPSEVKKLVTLGDHARNHLWIFFALAFFFSIATALTAGHFWNENKQMVDQIERGERLENSYRKFHQYMTKKHPQDTKAFFNQK